MDTSSIPLRQCSKKEKCVNPLGSWLPATTEYFYRRSARKGGLCYECKACTSYRDRLHHDERLARQRRYYQENPEYGREHCRRYYHKNIVKERERARKYKQAHYEDTLQRRRMHQKAHPEIDRLKRNRRYARKRALPDTLTQEQWKYALEYFNGCCAICGRQLNDLFGTRTAAMDHWIPLTSPECLGTVALNVVPLCHGESGCNNRKRDQMPSVYLEETFGSRKAKAILARIQTYFDSLIV